MTDISPFLGIRGNFPGLALGLSRSRRKGSQICCVGISVPERVQKGTWAG